MKFYSYSDLHRDIATLASKLPVDIVGVIGVPRSGMLAASLLSLHRHIHLTDAETFASTGKFYTPGGRLGQVRPEPKAGKILLVDDSCNRGGSLSIAADKIRASKWSSQFEILRGCVYSTTRVAETPLLDYWGRIEDDVRVFQWNLFAERRLSSWACDIDGVICYDPPSEGDEASYEQYIANAKPLYLPRHRVGALITCRLEKRRAATEDWLRRHGVEWEKLVMFPAATAGERRRDCSARSNKRSNLQREGRVDGYGIWKSEMLKQAGCRAMIESNKGQAEAIANIAKRPVVCTANWQMYGGR